MYRILMVCLGNICRSPMAEFVLRDMLQKRGYTGVEVASAAISDEEEGNRVHRGTAKILDRLGIDYSSKRARQMLPSDYGSYDLLLGMENRHLSSMKRIVSSYDNRSAKIFRLLDFSENPRDIADPWYTGDFEKTYDDIREGCEALISWLLECGIIS